MEKLIGNVRLKIKGSESEGEFRLLEFTDGKIDNGATYFTDSKEDAISTMEYRAKQIEREQKDKRDQMTSPVVLRDLIVIESYYGLNLAITLESLKERNPKLYEEVAMVFTTSRSVRKGDFTRIDVNTTFSNWAK